MIQLEFYLDTNCDLHIHVGYCIEYQARIGVNDVSSLGYVNFNTLYNLVARHMPIVSPMLLKLGNFKDTCTLLDAGTMYIHYSKRGNLYVCRVYAYLNMNRVPGVDSKVLLYEEIIPTDVLKLQL